ncbi:jg17229 [Pararge aegeria aegeria]|uniref:Jg17229 protein n=1 Tax=Pararge aegeria aegeria TaxID=348720 RepID=A0A8S4S8X2_9NEOP|nr:jg17229 [Pararge aegeria aegeria]
MSRTSLQNTFSIVDGRRRNGHPERRLAARNRIAAIRVAIFCVANMHRVASQFCVQALSQLMPRKGRRRARKKKDPIISRTLGHAVRRTSLKPSTPNG